MVRKQTSLSELAPAIEALVQDLVRSGAARVDGSVVYNV
jgi:hypothetical protein